MGADERPVPDAPGATPGPGPRGAAALLLAIFLAGAAVMILEMTAVRAVQPFFGATTWVWTNVIAVVLGALAVGYAAGGRLADRCPSPALLHGLLAGAGLLLAAVAALVTPVSRLFLADGVDLDGIVSVSHRGSLGTSLLLFAPPVLVLGTVSPLAIRLLADGGVGRAAGRVFAVSTVGSIAGTYLPTHVLVPRLGSRGTLLVAAALLLVAAAVGLVAAGRRRGVAALAVLVAAGALAGALGHVLRPGRGAPPLAEGGVSEVLAEVESPYQYLAVRRDAWGTSAWRVLTINEAVRTFHAMQPEGGVMTGSLYYDVYTLLPLLLDLAPGEELRAAVVGMACGVNAREWHHVWSEVHPLRVDGAEIDPTVVALGREHFGLPGPEAAWLRVRVMDGRQMLEAAPTTTRYHQIVVDAFANELYVPFHLGTREFFSLCRRHLEPGGVLAMNVWAVGEDAPNLRALERTLAAVFGRCLRVRLYEGGGHLLLARAGDEAPDLARWRPAAVEARLAAWAGHAAWARSEAAGDLTRLLEEVAEARDGARLVVAAPGDEVLTDDHAPLAWLTDRFLRTTEARALAGDDARAAGVRALERRQRWLLGAVAAGWALLVLLVAWRARR